MAILPVTADDIEVFTTLVNPTRSYSSSSSGVTGSLSVFSRFSHLEKEVRPLSNFQSSVVSDSDIEIARMAAVNAAKKQSFFPVAESFLTRVNQQSISAKNFKKLEINRFTPSVSFTQNTVRKLNVKDILMPYYNTAYTTAQWCYTNYHSLNFFTSPSVPTSSVLLYPNIDNEVIPLHMGYASGTYSLSGGFSFDFSINPRYQTDSIDDGHFKAGTVFHLSSSYALSLVTGSAKDPNGLPTSFRLLLQLSHSADIPPSRAIPGSYPNDLIFLSDDNSLDWNKWHRVVVRWGTSLVNDGTGSFNINNVDKGAFVVPSGTIMPKIFIGKDDPRVLSIGNFYEGTNAGLNSTSLFFGNIASTREGLIPLINDDKQYDAPAHSYFRHPLKAEVHNLAIKRYYIPNSEISSSAGKGIDAIDRRDIAFLLPPYFVENTPVRKFTEAPSLGGTAWGGILQTPFFEIDGSTDDPFNVAMAFGVNGHYINLENFVQDFANLNFPRLHHLSGNAIDYTTQAREANEFLYDNSFVRKRNLTVLPCDDGNFVPNFSLLKKEIGNKYVNAYGQKDLSVINLEKLLYTSSLLFSAQHDADYDSTFLDQQIGFNPENPGLPPGPAVLSKKRTIENAVATQEQDYNPGVQRDMPLTIYQRTKDDSSNQVTFFNISNLFYGSRILPGSFQISDSSMTGSGGGVSITLRDDGFGNIYRADSLSPHCTWNSVGNIFYSEGIVVIKSPHLYFFGKDQFEISFKGEHQLHSSKYEVLAPQGLLNSSSNPTYAALCNVISASSDPLDNGVFAYISNINLHDENLNVVAKAVLAQPVIKREGEKILFKIAFDF